jgi:hypothetical protein
MPLNGRSLDPRIKQKLLNEYLWDDYGIRLSYNDSSSLCIGIGARKVADKVIRIENPITINTTNLITGTNFSNSTMYYCYIDEDINIYIDTEKPTRNDEGNTVSSDCEKEIYHPTEEYRFIGSFRTLSDGSIAKFNIMNDMVIYETGLNHLLMDYKSNINPDSVNCRSLIPYTSKLASVYFYSNHKDNLKYIGTPDAWYSNIGRWGETVNIPIVNDSIYFFCDNKKIYIAIVGYKEVI